METISQREMRNNSAEVLRRVAAGESFLVTNGGVPAAVISPPPASTSEALVASGRLTLGSGLNLDELPTPVESSLSSTEVLDEDRG